MTHKIPERPIEYQTRDTYLGIRLPSKLKDKVTRAAGESECTASSYIVYLLAKHFEQGAEQGATRG